MKRGFLVGARARSKIEMDTRSDPAGRQDSRLGCPAWWCVLIVWLLAGSLGMGCAQLRECTEISTGVGLKIVRDGISYDTSAPPQSDLVSVAQRLNAKLSNDVDEFHLVGGNLVIIARCVDRHPKSKGDFDESTIEQLDLRQVILEVWGNVQPENRNGVKGYLASMQYVLIPARVNELQGRPPRSVYVVEKWQRSGAPAEEIFRQEGELGLYTHIATGMKALNKKQYDQAVKYLCQGQILLGQKASPSPADARADLLKYVEDLTTETFQKARQDPTYTGWMKTLATGSEPSPCRQGGH